MKLSWQFVVLMVVSGVLIFWRMNDSYVAFTDELLFEEAGYRMAFGGVIDDEKGHPLQLPLEKGESNKWLVPVNNGEVWLEKPPLYFWLTGGMFWVVDKFRTLYPLSEALMPNGEFVFPWIRRFWSMAAGLVTVGLTYGVARLVTKERRDGKTEGLMNGRTSLPLLAAFLLLASPLFLATTKSGSLDMLATALMTGAVWVYLGSNNLKFLKVRNKALTNLRSSTVSSTSTALSVKTLLSRTRVVFIGLLCGVAVMARSFLGLTPIGLIVVDQLLNKDSRWRLSEWMVFGLTFSFVVLPWHWAMYRMFPDEFINTYLGFNVVKHAVQLTPGYQETSVFYYLVELVRNIPWLLPFGLAGGLFGLYFRRNEAHRVSRINTGISRIIESNNIKVLIVWVLGPLVILSLASTRHSWYLVQITPALAILMAGLCLRAYQYVTVCSKCKVLKYFTQMSFLALTLASVLTVLVVVDPSAPTVKVVRWARENVSPEKKVYSFGNNFLPSTLLFSPHPVDFTQDLSELSKGALVFVADFQINDAEEQVSNWELVQEFRLGKVYKI